jgi:hypothetical protein
VPRTPLPTAVIDTSSAPTRQNASRPATTAPVA